MKKLLLIGSICFFSIGFEAQSQSVEAGMHFNYNIADKDIMPKMDDARSFGFSLGYQPNDNIPLVLEFKSSFGNYGKVVTQTNNFSMDGVNYTELDVRYKNGLNTFLFGTKLAHYNSKFRVMPFITPQIGMGTTRASIYIPDPNDIDDCAPLENNVAHKYRGFVYGGEAGLNIDVGNRGKDHKVILFISASILKSTKSFNYINVRHMEDFTHVANHNDEEHHDHGNHHPSRKEGEITTPFINLESDIVHDHKIAELYNSRLNFMGINFGIIINF